MGTGAGAESQAPPKAARIEVDKTVTSVEVTPGLAFDFGVDRADAIPGDALTYQGTLRHTGATLRLLGEIEIHNVGMVEATLASFFDVVETSATLHANACWAAPEDPGARAAGRRTASTDPLGHTTAFTYDPSGRLTSITDPLGRTSTHTYDPTGRRMATTDPAGARSTFGYDPLGRVTSITDALGGMVTSAYDPTGRLVAVEITSLFMRRPSRRAWRVSTSAATSCSGRPRCTW